MKLWACLCAVLTATSVHASIIFNDSSGDIDPGLSTGNGTLDILSMEVSHTASDLIFALTLNGNVSTTDWGKFMIGIATGASGTAGNGWGRPINLDSTAGGMDFWIGSWVDGGSGAQLWSYSGSWSMGTAPGFTVTPGAQSVLTYTVPRATLGLTGNDTFYFDAYASGGGGTDSAIDALANPNVSVTAWDQTYTSSGGSGVLAYAIPEPSTLALLGVGALMGLGWFHRRIRRG
jgi:hypothetical protein